MLEEMLTVDNMDDEVYMDGILGEILQELRENKIDIEELSKNKRRVVVGSFHTLNSLISQWHLEKRYSIVDIVVALDNYGYSIGDVLSVLSCENQLFLREALAKKYNKKIVTVTDSSDFFE